MLVNCQSSCPFKSPYSYRHLHYRPNLLEKQLQLVKPTSQPTTMKFFRIILHPISKKSQLDLPDAFMTQYMETTRTRATLEIPDGRKWRVTIKKKDNKVWLRRGWPDFATSLKLKPGSFLMFNYHEMQRVFLVEVFDTSTCEIQYPSRTNACDECVHEPVLKRPKVEEMMDEENDEDDVHEPALKRPNAEEMMDEENDEDEDDVKPRMSMDKRFRFRKVKREIDEPPASCNNNNYKDQASNRDSKHNVHGTFRSGGRRSFNERAFQLVVQRWRMSRSTKAIKRAFRRVLSTRFRGPNVVILMQRTHVRPPHYQLGLPKKFIRRYFKLANKNITLKVDERGTTWSGVYSIKKHSNTKVKGGWKALAIYKRLQVGDICVFELLGGLENSLKIHIFRAVEGGG